MIVTFSSPPICPDIMRDQHSTSSTRKHLSSPSTSSTRRIH